MNYKITIERREPNPNFEVEYNEWKDKNRYNGYDLNKPQEEIITNALICELTEEQYKAIKAQVFNTFE